MHIGRSQTAYDLGPALRDRAKADGVVGTFVIELPAISTIRALALAGFDFVVIDTEHSVFGLEAVEPLVLAAQSLGLAALIRVWGEETGLIGKALETGANGLLIPHVDSVERARQIVAETRFAPLGSRSFSPLLRYDEVSQSKAGIEAATIVIAQIEGKEALAAAPEIADLRGIDGIFIGTHDLSLSLSVEPDDPAIRETASTLAARLPAGRIKGVYLDEPEQCGSWAQLGYRLQCVSFDGRMLANAARALVQATRLQEAAQ